MMKKTKIKERVVGLAGPALLMASLLTSCGGGGGGASYSFTPTEITTQAQVKESSKGIRIINEIVSLGGDQIDTLALENKKGFLKAVLKSIEDKDFHQISTKELFNCEISGSVEAIQTGENEGYLKFHNCQINKCETLTGTLWVSLKDENNNNIPEKVTLLFKKGFFYQNECENSWLKIADNFSMSLEGKLPNNDIYTGGGMKIKAEIQLDGGDIIANDAGRQSLAHFYNLRFFENEVDNNPVIEYSINGGIKLKSDCLEDTINAVYETIEMFKEYADADCPYEGKLIINDKISLEAYDPDQNPHSFNKIKISLGDEIIFDDDCKNLESLGVCPE